MYAIQWIVHDSTPLAVSCHGSLNLPAAIAAAIAEVQKHDSGLVRIVRVDECGICEGRGTTVDLYSDSTRCYQCSGIGKTFGPASLFTRATLLNLAAQPVNDWPKVLPEEVFGDTGPVAGG